MKVVLILTLSFYSYVATAIEFRDPLAMFEKQFITIEKHSRTPASCTNCDVVNFDRGPGPHFQSFVITMTGPTRLTAPPLDPKEKVQRRWEFISDYIRITDDAGSGYLSQRMETIIVLLPRFGQPSIKNVNDEQHVTLSTGEKIIFDQATRLIKDGVIIEGPIDNASDRKSRRFASLTYFGTGITIRLDKRGEDPRVASDVAQVTQRGKSCVLPIKELWSSNLEFKYPDDEELLFFLNSKCDGIFNL